MTLLQALVHFCREATLNLLRGWRVSLLVAVTIGVSLFVGGLFLFLSSAVERSIVAWRAEAKVVAYLTAESTPEDARAIAQEVRLVPWVTGAEVVSADEARRRFRLAFPGLAELLAADDPLPPSLELGLAEGAEDEARFEAWLAELRRRPGVVMVDDDRQWLRQVESFATLLRSVGYGLGGLLLVSAVLTTASVIRLTAHVYRDEIAVLRLVGGTDFFIRGPFVVEGTLQGLAGGVLAALALLTVGVSIDRNAPELAAVGLGVPAAPPALALAALLALGAVAGFFGALLSLRWRRDRL